jgi:uncharacterized membrane protein
MFKTLLVLHLLGLALGVGGGVGNMIAGRMAAKAEPAGAKALGALQGRIGRASFVGLILLWITGIWTVMGYHDGGFGALPGTFSVKMIFVVIVTLAALAAQWKAMSAARAGTPPNRKTMARLGMVSGLFSILAVVMAVATFA